MSKEEEQDRKIAALERAYAELVKLLDEHGKQRTLFNTSINGKVDELQMWFKKHDDKEMKKYDLILEAIKEQSELVGKVDRKVHNVATETEKNTAFMAKLKKYWFGITMSFSAVAVVLTAAYWLLGVMQEKGMIILFPTGA